MKCRHRKCWLICGGLVTWCYQCGAWRQMRHVTHNGVAPVGPWCVPSGPGGFNPYDQFEKRQKAYRKRNGQEYF
jgi:hypothetical protein